MVDRQEIVLVDPLSNDPRLKNVYFRKVCSPAQISVPRLAHCLGIVFHSRQNWGVVGDLPVPTGEDIEHYRFPSLEAPISSITPEERKTMKVLLTGATYVLNGNPIVNLACESYQRTVRKFVESTLAAGGFRPHMIEELYAPPNTLTHLKYNPQTAYVEIRRKNVREHMDSTTSLFLY